MGPPVRLPDRGLVAREMFTCSDQWTRVPLARCPRRRTEGWLAEWIPNALRPLASHCVKWRTWFLVEKTDWLCDTLQVVLNPFFFLCADVLVLLRFRNSSVATIPMAVDCNFRQVDSLTIRQQRLVVPLVLKQSQSTVGLHPKNYKAHLVNTMHTWCARKH